MENEIIPTTAAEINLLEAQDYTHFEYGTQGQRFLNWLIDNVLTRICLTYATGYFIGLGIGLLSITAQQEIYNGIIEKTFTYYLISYLVVAVNYIFYYTICEKLFRGYTLGKLITGTRAVRQDGEELTLKDAFMRSLCRIVPFEVFSGFSTLTWHDKWTNTMVIKSR